MIARILFFLFTLIVIFFNVHANILFCQTPHWIALPNSPFMGTSNRFEDIFFTNANTGWIVHGSGKVFRTTNGGNNWDTMFTTSSGEFRSIGFFDSQTGLLGTLHSDSNRVLYRTTNGGINFTAITNLPNPRILGTCGINIVNNNVAYACGRWYTPARIIKTTDKGITWSSFTIDTSLANSLVDCYFWSPDSGIAVGGYRTINFSAGKSAVIMTTNGGTTWQRVYVSTRNSEYCWKISFISRNIGFVSIETNLFSYYLKTTNGGLNWEDKPFRNFVQQGIGFVNETTGWIGGWGGPNYETTDAGTSWHLADWGNVVNRFRFLSDTLAYAVGNRVFKYSTENVGIHLSSSEIPDKYNLFQNYPNPFNPVTKISFSIPNTQYTILNVYDAIGREVETLVNEKLSPGIYEVEFTGNNFPSGIYFYKLSAGYYSDVKRMILIK